MFIGDEMPGHDRACTSAYNLLNRTAQNIWRTASPDQVTFEHGLAEYLAMFDLLGIPGPGYCQRCDGRGWVPRMAGEPGAMYQMRAECTLCHGSGKVPK